MKSLPALSVSQLLFRPSKLGLASLLPVVMLAWGCPVLSSQTATFAAAPTFVTDINSISATGVDGVGDVFTLVFPNTLIEIPYTMIGFGPEITLPLKVSIASAIAPDAAGNLFVCDSLSSRIVELPRTATGYGPQVTLKASVAYPSAVAVDNLGNVFISDSVGQAGRISELPKTANGYGPQETISTNQSYSPTLTVDPEGNLFFLDSLYDYISNTSPHLLELPRTSSGYGPPTLLPTGSGNYSVAADGVGNLFLSATLDGGGSVQIAELPRTANGYGPEVTLLGGLYNNGGNEIAASGNGNVIASGERFGLAKIQTRSVDFDGVAVCATEEPKPSFCSNTVTLNYNIMASGTLGVPKVLTGGGPNLDFTLASGSTCIGAVTAGATCTVNVSFSPLAVGARNGSVETIDGNGKVLSTVSLSGIGVTSPSVNFGEGFAASQGTLQLNGNASLTGSALEMNNRTPNEASSAFYSSPVDIRNFTTDFTFEQTKTGADGFTFTVQNVGPGALGGDGGSLGYAGISHSIAVKFDTYKNKDEPSGNTTGMYVGGALPIAGPTGVDLDTTDINLHSGDILDAHLTYDGTTLNLTLTDSVTHATTSIPFKINIPAAVGANSAYVGFTSATGQTPRA